MWTTIKIIDFSYGHRLMDYDGPCKNPHGHNGRVEIVCRADTLDSTGMGMDFGRIKSVVKNFIDTHWDHAMLLRRSDPLVAEMAARGEKTFLFDENPTAEVLAAHLHAIARKDGLPVVEIRFHETPTSIACYSEETNA